MNYRECETDTEADGPRKGRGEMSKVVDDVSVDQLGERDQHDSIADKKALCKDPVASLDQDSIEEPIKEKKARANRVLCESEPAPSFRNVRRCDHGPKNNCGHKLADNGKLK